MIYGPVKNYDPFNTISSVCFGYKGTSDLRTTTSVMLIYLFVKTYDDLGSFFDNYSSSLGITILSHRFYLPSPFGETLSVSYSLFGIPLDPSPENSSPSFTILVFSLVEPHIYISFLMRYTNLSLLSSLSFPLLIYVDLSGLGLFLCLHFSLVSSGDMIQCTVLMKVSLVF